jgi:signal transduction histidine kinase
MTATVRFVRDLIPSTIELRSEISADAGRALINRTEFTQVIVNLAQNAADAIDRAGTISITTKIVNLGGHRAIQRHLSDGRYYRVSVKDTGSGMAAETLKRIFEPFFTTKPAGKGTGLGLSVVYGIVTGWGGSVSADSVVGEGSVFDVYIPLM